MNSFAYQLGVAAADGVWRGEKLGTRWGTARRAHNAEV